MNEADTIPEVVCPFYHAEEGARLKCEGFCSTTTLQICFSNKSQFKMHKVAHCMNMRGYRRCPLYSVIARQYDEL